MSKIIAKWQKQGIICQYCTNQIADNCFIIKCLLKLNMAKVFLLTHLLHQVYLMHGNATLVQTSRSKLFDSFAFSLTRPIPRNSQNRRNPRKIIIAFLHRWNSLRIISQITLIPFHGFFLLNINPILFSASSAFSAMILYVKTKTRNSWKDSETFIYCTSEE